MYKELIYNVLSDLVTSAEGVNPLVKGLIQLMMKDASEQRAKLCYELISARIHKFEDSQSQRQQELTFRL